MTEVELREAFDTLAGNFYDYYKAVHNVRPRHMVLDSERLETRQQVEEAMSHLQRAMDGLSDYMEARKSTFEGREELRCEGWVIEETDPELIARAAARKAERDAFRAEQEYRYSHEGHLAQLAERARARAEQEANDLESYFYDRYEVAA